MPLVRPARSRPRRAVRVLAAAVLAAAPAAAAAHFGMSHAGVEEARAHLAARPAMGGVEVPLSPPPASASPAFELIDQHGAVRRHTEFLGRPYLLFFGYAVNQALCLVPVERLAEARAHLAAAGIDLPVLMVTLDPQRDTPEAMRVAVPEIDPQMTAMTGGPRTLARVRAAFGDLPTRVEDLIDGTPVYSRSSLLYLVGPEGELRAVIPSAMTADRLAEVLAGEL